MTAINQYYPVEGVPEFWEWLAHRAAAGDIKILIEMFDEIREGGRGDERDHLFAWIRMEANRAALLLGEEVDEDRVRTVITEGYAPDLNDAELEQMGHDPFLIAYGLAVPADCCVVSTEVSKPRRTGQNRHIPDVCNELGVPWCNTFAMTRALGFTTRWQAAPG
jgi:hypothetical protein